MKFLRLTILVWVLLVLGGPNLFADVSREERAYTAAVAEFQDENWSRAEAAFSQFTQNFPKSGRVAEAALFQAQSLCKQGKFSDAITVLNQRRNKAGALADRYAYWLGEAQSGQGDYATAAATFTALAGGPAESPLKLPATVAAANAFEKLGDARRLEELLGATNGVFARAAEVDAANELVVRGRLLLAQSRFERQDLTGAQAILNRLNLPVLAPGLEWQRLYLTGRVKLSAGDLSGALVTTTNLLAAQKDPERVADALALRGVILEKMGQPASAISIWSANLTNSVSASKQRTAILKISALALAQNNIPDAAAGLEKYLEQAGNSSARDLALLTLGELQLKNLAVTNHLTLAQARLDQLLAATNPPSALAGRAFLARGWCRWLADDVANSLTDFQMAAARLPVSEEQAVAKFKTADAQFALKDFALARENYLSVLNQYDAVPAVAKALENRALYQLLRVDLELQDLAGAEQILKRLLEKFPDSAQVDDSLLLVGEAFADSSSPAKAREVLAQFAELAPDSPLAPEAKLAAARTYEREQNWPAAIARYEAWIQKFPGHALLPQAEYARALANFYGGNETNAFTLFTGFVTRFATNELAPLAQWWVADHYFRAGNFPEAERNYELIFQTPGWKSSDLFYPSQLMAARAAAGRQGFADAANYLTKLVADTNCPSALTTQAMFAYGGVLMRWDSTDTNHPFANFELATNVFGQIFAANPTNEIGALASSEFADCALQLGAFEQATNAYARVIASPHAGPGLRQRAQVGLGLVLEKQASQLPPEERTPLLRAALGHYRDVLYTTDDAASPFWVKKAGLQALPLMIALKDGDVDKFFERLEHWLPQLKETLEKKKAALTATRN